MIIYDVVDNDEKAEFLGCQGANLELSFFSTPAKVFVIIIHVIIINIINIIIHIFVVIIIIIIIIVIIIIIILSSSGYILQMQGANFEGSFF